MWFSSCASFSQLCRGGPGGRKKLMLYRFQLFSRRYNITQIGENDIGKLPMPLLRIKVDTLFVLIQHQPGLRRLRTPKEHNSIVSYKIDGMRNDKLGTQLPHWSFADPKRTLWPYICCQKTNHASATPNSMF